MGKSKKGLSDKVRKSQTAKAKNVFQVKNNPFEVKINKQKHKILGRKSKHDRGLPGVSRSKANKKRKDTLLKEYKDRHRSNQLTDERFGEENVDMSVEEKMLKRFAMEKKKKHEKMSMFNLNDEEELTHFGQSLANIHDFETEVISDDEDNGTISGEYVADAHFGGGIFTKKNQEENADVEKPKSRKEVMDEIIMKSKKAKFDRQTTQEQSIALREKLDSTWQELQDLLKSSSKTKKDKESEKEKYKPDAYDVAVRQMQYDRRAAPAPRGKTEAEKAAEEAARLRKLEDERFQRMQESYTNSRASKHRSPDELNDGFISEKITAEPVCYKDGVLIGNAPLSDDAETQFQSDTDQDIQIVTDPFSEVTENQSDEEEDDENDADDFSDILSGDDENSRTGDSDENEDSGNASLDREVTSSERKTDMFPLTYDEFLQLVEMTYEKDHVKCITDLQKKFAPAAAAGNKNRMKILFEHVWKVTCDLFSAGVTNMTYINALIRTLYDLCQMNIVDCARYAIKSLRQTYKSCQREDGKLSMPYLGQLIQLKLIKILFATSDFSHPVCTPALLFMSHIIKSHRPANLRDLSFGLFVCTLIYEYVCYSKRFLPECINYLCAALCFSIPKSVQKHKGIPASASLHITANNCELLILKNNQQFSNELIKKPNLLAILAIDKGGLPNDDVVRLQLQQVVLRLIQKFILIYGNLPCFKEIFDPISVSCKRCVIGYRQQCEQHTEYPLAGLLLELQGEIQRIVKRHPSTAPLVQVESNRPVALPLYEPKIEAVGEPFRKGGQKNISASRREKERLQHKFKRELKGAVREIKKDARFLARERLNDQIEKDQERAAKVKRLFGLLSNQEGEVKKINRKRFKLDVS